MLLGRSKKAEGVNIDWHTCYWSKLIMQIYWTRK